MNRKEARKLLLKKSEEMIEVLLDSLYPETDGVRGYLKQTLSEPPLMDKKYFIPAGTLLGFVNEEIEADLNSTSLGKLMGSLGFESFDVYYKKKQRRGYYVEIKSNAIFLNYKQYEERKLGK